MGVSKKPSNMYKVILASALVATAFAAGPPAYGAPAPYAPEKLPPQPLLMSMESTMTTARLTSRRQKHKMPTVLSRVASRLLFLMAVSRPPPTLLTTPTDSSPRSPMREPQSTPQSPQVDTDPPPLPTSPLLKFQYILMKKPNLLLQISTKTDD